MSAQTQLPEVERGSESESNSFNSEDNCPSVKAHMVSVAVQTQIDDQTSSRADDSDSPQHRVGDSPPASDLQLSFVKLQSDASFLDGPCASDTKDFVSVASDSCI